MIEIQVPSSKSVTQRALILAGLSDCPSKIQNPLDCDDSRALRAGLAQLGVSSRSDGSYLIITPPDTIKLPPKELYLHNAGTAVRFLTGLAPLIPGTYVVDGNAAMRTRPMPGLLDALRSMGVEITEMGRAGCPPIRLTPTTPTTNAIELRAGGSSQELSALMLMASRLPQGLTITIQGKMPSKPYIDLTLETLRAFSIQVQSEGDNVFYIPATIPRLTPAPEHDDRVFQVEGDWSSASYPLAASWLTGIPVKLSNLNTHSKQGDRAIQSILTQLSEPGPRVLDLTDTPDIAPTVAACALFASESTKITGIAHLRIKESDRIAVLARELGKLGADLIETHDSLTITPTELFGPAELDPAEDHRMAMVFGLLTLKISNLRIKDPHCVTKSYPDYWEMLQRFHPYQI